MLQRNMGSKHFARSDDITPEHRRRGSRLAALRILHAYCIEKCPTAWIFILFPANA